MNQLNTKILKKTIAGAGLLATTPVWGKTQPGVDHLSLEESPGQNVTLCSDPDNISTKTGNNLTPNEMTIGVDLLDNYIEIIFTVRDILSQDKDHVLFLVYSPDESPSPQIPTPDSVKELKLDMAALEILAIYNIPAQQLVAADPTRIGLARPRPHSAFSFSVNLDIENIKSFVRNNEAIHLQAAFMKKADFDEGEFDRLILSEMDTIWFVQEQTCPDGQASMGVDNDGTLTTTSASGNTTKTQETSSTSSSSTSVTKAGSSTTTGGEGGSSGGGGGK